MVDLIRLLLDFAAFYSLYLMLSLSLNLEYGYTGIPNFGKVMFFALGAFVTGSLAARLVAPLAGVDLSAIDYRLNNVLVGTLVTQYFAAHPHVAVAVLVLMMVLGALIGLAFGWLASYPAIRLREDYLGMTLIVAGELVRVVGRNYDPLIGGTLGVFVPNPFSWMGGVTMDVVRSGFMLSVALLVWLFVGRITASPFGRMMKAIRESELAAEVLGKDVVKTRMMVLMMGSAIAGLAGSLYAFYIGEVHADDFAPIRTFTIWVMVIIGGAGNNLGAAAGALLYLLIDRFLAIVKHQMVVPFDVNYLSYILFGIVLILVLMYSSEGMIPEKPEILAGRKRESS